MFHVKQLIKFSFLLLSLEGYGQQMLLFKEGSIPHPKTIEKNISEWNEKQPGYKTLSTKEQQFYYWVNYSRSNPAKFFDSVVTPMIDMYPQLKGENLESLETDLETAEALPLFYLNDSLIKMASAHAADITSNNAKPSHASTNGESFADRFKRFDLKNCGGENISYSVGDSDPLFMLVLLYLDINVPDLGHRKALLNPVYINTGIGAATYKNGNTFIVEDFACSQN